MTVYVDDSGIRATVTDEATGRQYTSRWSHLFCDGDLDELHLFAVLLGLKYSWFQGPPKHKFPHYDVTATKRVKAIRLGARPVTWREAIKIMKTLRPGKSRDA